MPGIPVPIVKQRVRDDLQLPGYRQNLRASPDAFGASIGEGAAKTAQVAGGIWAKEQEDADSSAMLGAYAEGQRAVIEHEKILASFEGRDAVKQSESLTAQLSKKLDNISANLNNDRQRAQFAKMRQQFQLGFESNVSNHIVRAQDQQFDNNFKSSVEMATEAGNPDVLVMAVDTYASHRGVPRLKDGKIDKTSEPYRALLLRTMAPLHKNKLSTMSTMNDYEGMKRYVADFGEQMTSNMRDKVKVDIQKAETRAGGVELFNMAQSAGMSPDGFYLDLRAAEAAMQPSEETAMDSTGVAAPSKSYTPEMRAEAEKHLAALKTQVDARRKSHDEPIVEGLKMTIDTGGKVTGNEPEFGKMSLEGQQEVMAYVRRDQREDERARDEHDLILRLQYQQLTPPQQRALNVDGTEPWRSGSKKLREGLKADKQGLLNKSGMSNEESNERARQAAVEHGYSTKARKQGEASDAQLFTARIGQHFDAWSKDPKNEGLKPSLELWASWDAEATRTVVVSENPARKFINKALGTHFEEQQTAPAFKAPPTATPAISDADRARISARYKAKNLPPPDDAKILRVLEFEKKASP